VAIFIDRQYSKCRYHTFSLARKYAKSPGNLSYGSRTLQTTKGEETPYFTTNNMICFRPLWKPRVVHAFSEGRVKNLPYIGMWETERSAEIYIGENYADRKS